MKWYKVEEGYPDYKVLAYGKGELIIGYIEKHDGSTYGGEFMVENEFEILDKVTHWMELPEPPK